MSFLRPNARRFALLAAVLIVGGVGTAPAQAADSPQTPKGNATYSTGTVTRATFYENAGFGGYTLKILGSTSCTASTTTPDTRLSNIDTKVSPNWNDAISSVRDYSSCDVKLYQDAISNPQTGNVTGYVNYGSGGQSFQDNFWNDRISGIDVS